MSELRIRTRGMILLFCLAAAWFGNPTSGFAQDDHAGHDHAGHDHSDGHEHPIPKRAAFDFKAWENLPIQEEGLEKSLFTYAKESVREITGKANYGGRGPVENLFSMAFEPELWAEQRVLKVDHPDLRKVFDGKKYISVHDMEDKRSVWMPMVESGKKKDEINREMQHLFTKAELMLKKSSHLAIVPTQSFTGDTDVWRTVEELDARTKDKSPTETQLTSAWRDVQIAFHEQDAAKFNAATAQAVQAAHGIRTPVMSPQWKINLDRWDSHVGLFRLAGWVYLLAAIIFLISYLAGEKIFSIVAGSALGIGIVLHIAALVIRGILAGRTPVANLFESAVFIIGAMTLLSLIFSIYYRTRVVGLAGATLGAFFMGIANNIPLHYGRKVMPLIDALQSYWLRIHVTSMLISYAFFAIAFSVAVAYVVRSWYLRRGAIIGGGAAVADVSADTRLQYLDGLNFRIITIGFPILTGGVILGAVWASEAWGRPWAFDPKETAAAITWMIYAIYLHCRLFLGWRDSRGVWLSILGFGAVVFTYLGVSFFLPGLHSYVSEDGVSFTEFLKKLIPGI